MKVIELRNYLLKPGARDRFSEYFKTHFIESQNALGAYTPGQYRVKEEDDRFFWVRGFGSMQERSQFLPAFYGGDVWKEFGPAANDMMLEWQNVHLLKPVINNTPAFDKKQELLVIDYYTAVNNQLVELVELFSELWLPRCHSLGISNISLWVSEMAENDFPRLPVHQEENLLVVLTGYHSEEEYKFILDRLGDGLEFNNKTKELVMNKRTLLLYPARS